MAIRPNKQQECSYAMHHKQDRGATQYAVFAM
jgi:hypothetical protein